MTKYQIYICCRVRTLIEFLRRALIDPDAPTAGGSSPRLFLDGACAGLVLPFPGGCCTEIHIPCMVWVAKVARAIERLTRCARFG